MPDQMGAELLARQMVNEGVEDLFYIMGGPIIEAAGFAAEHGIRTIDCRHEQGAAMAAHGYARVKRVPGVCMAASGPATTNLLTGIANAYLDGVPMVALGGAAAFSSFERDDFQEYDQLAMAAPVTRWSSRVTHSARMPEFFNLAYREAQGPKPGPTLPRPARRHALHPVRRRDRLVSQNRSTKVSSEPLTPTRSSKRLSCSQTPSGQSC